MNDGRPWSKFYWRDWRGDECLRQCSLAARGLWIDMLSLMHTAEPHGHLVTSDGAPMDTRTLAKLVSARAAIVQKCITELTQTGVCSIAANGALYSRRMIRDRKKTLDAIEDGRRGGNPALLKLVNLRVKGLDKPSRARVPEARSQMPDVDAATAATWLQLWNDNRGPLREVKEINAKRLRGIASLLALNADLEYWRDVIRRAAAAPGCNGQNKYKWRIHLDHLFDDTKRTTLIEGGYDTKFGTAQAAAAPPTGPRTPSAAETRRLYLNRDKAASA